MLRMPGCGMSKIGRNIRAARLSAGLTQKYVGDELGISGNAISAWERGKNSPSDYELKRVAKICGVTVENLEQGTVPRPDPPELKEYQKEQLFAIALRQIDMSRAKVKDRRAFARYLLDGMTAAAAEYMKCMNKPIEGNGEE